MLLGFIQLCVSVCLPVCLSVCVCVSACGQGMGGGGGGLRIDTPPPRQPRDLMILLFLRFFGEVFKCNYFIVSL